MVERWLWFYVNLFVNIRKIVKNFYSALYTSSVNSAKFLKWNHPPDDLYNPSLLSTNILLNMRRSRKICRMGVQLWRVFLFCFYLFFFVFFWWGERGSWYHHKRANISPPAKHHLNCVSLACNDDPTLNAGLVALWFFRGSRPILLETLLFFVIFCMVGLPLFGK